MIDNLYLIAHSVRGQPAFDIAERTQCCVCHADQNVVGFKVPATEDCTNCDGVGYDWIIPTSGHRAYPYKSWNLQELMSEAHCKPIPTMPDGVPDHYWHSGNDEVQARLNRIEDSPLLERLGLAPKTPFVRRV